MGLSCQAEIKSLQGQNSIRDKKIKEQKLLIEEYKKRYGA